MSVGRSVGRSVSRSVGRSVCRSVSLSVCRSVGLSVRRSVGLSVGRFVTHMLFSHFLIVLLVIMSIQSVIKLIQSVIKSIQSVIKKIQLNLVSFLLIFTSRLSATAPTRDWCRVYGLVFYIRVITPLFFRSRCICTNTIRPKSQSFNNYYVNNRRLNWAPEPIFFTINTIKDWKNIEMHNLSDELIIFTRNFFTFLEVEAEAEAIFFLKPLPHPRSKYIYFK
jgi:hypothetical protein